LKERETGAKESTQTISDGEEIDGCEEGIQEEIVRWGMHLSGAQPWSVFMTTEEGVERTESL
jgi:hypothetical protein